MNGKQKKRMAVDVLMTAALLLLMPYGMVGDCLLYTSRCV